IDPGHEPSLGGGIDGQQRRGDVPQRQQVLLQGQGDNPPNSQRGSREQAHQPNPRLSCLRAVSTAREDATTRVRSGSSSGRWIWTTKLSAVVKTVLARPSHVLVMRATSLSALSRTLKFQARQFSALMDPCVWPPASRLKRILPIAF